MNYNRFIGVFYRKNKVSKMQTVFCNLRKQSISIISRLDTERLYSERNIIHIFKEGIKTANNAGTNDNRMSGNIDHKRTWFLFQTPKTGFTYAVGTEKTPL